MARRHRLTKKEQRGLGTLLLIALALSAIGSISSEGWKTIGAVGLVVFGLIALYFLMRALIAGIGGVFRKQAEDRAVETLSRKALAAAEKHVDALVRRRRQLVQSDAYGRAPLDAWIKELIYFLNTQVLPDLNEAEQHAFALHSAKVAYLIEVNVKERAETATPGPAFFDGMRPREYEHLCADYLRGAGWDARVTTHSRDFGVDVIAEKAGHRLVVQCKMYSSPVGIKAVQEIAAGRVHENANSAVVVSNQRFTAAAAQMAATNNVLLLHHEDLRKIDGALRLTAAPSLKDVIPSRP